jgi:hypothetical protein
MIACLHLPPVPLPHHLFHFSLFGHDIHPRMYLPAACPVTSAPPTHLLRTLADT